MIIQGLQVIGHNCFLVHYVLLLLSYQLDIYVVVAMDLLRCSGSKILVNVLLDREVLLFCSLLLLLLLSKI